MQKPNHYHSIHELFDDPAAEPQVLPKQQKKSSLQELMPLDTLEDALLEANKKGKPVYIAVRRNMGNLYTKDIHYGFVKKINLENHTVLFDDVDSNISYFMPTSEILSIEDPRAKRLHSSESSH